ncbi:MAG: GHKL domain-containing protein [Chloroflexaceae bacterium]|nr:GHKL domain-containing protein [Chloroflexaceae bacterium]
MIRNCAARCKIQGVDIERRYKPGLPTIQVDADLIREVLTNIIDNALEAMKGSGHIVVSVDADGAGHLLVQIRNTGSVLSEDLQEKIFEPFFTTKETGMGLGLAIVKQVIEGHGGRIAARGDTATGTTTATATMVLPTATGTITATTPPTTIATALPTPTLPAPTRTPGSPTVALSFSAGAPGSMFTLEIVDFAPDITATVRVNSRDIGTIDTEGGTFGLVVRFADAVTPGQYIIEIVPSTSLVQSTRAVATVTIGPDDPLRSRTDDGSLPVFDVPADIPALRKIYLPLLVRS